VADVDDDVLSIMVRPIQEPRSGGQLALEPRTVPRRRLVAGGPTGKPDPALTGRRQVPRRDTEVGDLPAAGMVVVDNDGMMGMIGSHEHSGT
jgi:hypothetical protein